MDSALQVKEGMEKRAEYHYDAFGNRRGQDIYSRPAGSGIPDMGVEKPQDPEQEIRYTLDITRPYHNLLVSEDNVRQKGQTFYWDGNVTAMEEAGRDSYYLQDDLGSPMQLVGENGEIRESYGFDEFGQPLHDDPEQQLQPFGFTGNQLEAAEGLYFAQARRYDTGTGRFVSEDSVRGSVTAPFTLNRYTYCWGNPVRLVDLGGRVPGEWEYGEATDYEGVYYLNAEKGAFNFGHAALLFVSEDGSGTFYSIAASTNEAAVYIHTYHNRTGKGDELLCGVPEGSEWNRNL